jgi:hypothetical protein
MRPFRKILKAYTDWLILVIVVILGLIFLLTIFFAMTRDTGHPESAAPLSLNYDKRDDNRGIQQIQPPDPKYPPPAKEQRAFYRSYVEGSVQYGIERTDINVDRHPKLGPHVFTIETSNMTNTVITIESDAARATTIGCVAQENPYRTLPVEPRSITLKPLEVKRTTLNADPLCVYIGTADGRYFWRIL